MRGGIDGTLQLGYQLGNGAVQVASEAANGSPVVRLLRLDTNGLKQHSGRDIVGVRDKWNRHPGVDGLILRAHVAQPPAGSGGEEKNARDRQHEGEPNSQRAPPRLSHNSI
ncbi:MAG: hypothetical protein ABSH46_14460 [Bryobacteraceae bacterium]|jgi:hypothetical protein